MHRRVLSVVGGVALGLVTGPAGACSLDLFVFQLPGETKAEARERSDKILADHAVTEHFERESYVFENAKLIYLARVVSRTPGSYGSDQRVLPSTKVRPLTALKGALPHRDLVLTDQAEGGMCTDIGDGEGAYGDVGRLLVVFEGLPKTEERPRGIDSFRTSSIRTVALLDKLSEHATVRND